MNFISKDTLRGKINEQGKTPLTILDLRPDTFYEAGHIDGAKCACVHEVSFLTKLQELCSDKTKPLVIYGPSAESFEAQKAHEILRLAGYRTVEVLQGGYCEWLGEKACETFYQDQRVTPAISKIFKLDLGTSRLQWFGRNAANNHTGQLRFSTGSIVVANSQLQSAELTIDMTSLSCDDLKDSPLNAMLIKHLRSEDFFLVEQFPTATATLKESKNISETPPPEENVEMTFTLNIRGKQAPMKARASLYLKPDSLNLQGHFRFDRTLFESIYGSKKFFKSLAGHMVNDLVELNFTLNAQ